MGSAFLGSGLKRRNTRTVSITSGKGGVGKTVLLSNVAIHLGRQGKKVLILDGDLAMANVDIAFGVRPKGTIYDVINGKKIMNDIIIEVAPSVFLIPGGSGIYDLQYLNRFQKRDLLEQISNIDFEFDYLLIDTGPGIDDNVLYLNSAAQEICIVVTPDPASLKDAYALIKVLNQKQKEDKFSIICNQVKDEKDGLALYKRLSDVVDKFLYVSLDYKGHVAWDPDLSRATKAQQLVARSNIYAPSNRLIMRLAENLSCSEDVGYAKGGLQFFWEQLLELA